ncbi:MAG: ABC transporter permease [Bacilli bacterium]
MKKLCILIKRHLKLYLKKPVNIVNSMISIIVILGLYFLFVREFTITAVIDYGFNSQYNSLFVDQLMVYGLLIVISTTSILPICNIFVDDKVKGIIKDFIVAPLSKLKIVYSYIFASIIVSLVFTTLSYLIINWFFINYYHLDFNFFNLINSLLIIFLSTIIASNLIFIIAIYINSNLSFSNFGNLLGVTIGFFTGVYIPIGYYPTIIRNIFFYFPLTQTTNMLRVINTNQTLNNILINYDSATHYLIKEIFGLRLTFNNYYFDIFKQIIFILISFLISNLIIFILVKKIETKK